MNPRVFTIDEAAKLLPKLEELLDALAKKKQEMQKKHDQLLVLDLIAGEKIHDYESRDGKEYLDKSAELETLILSFEEDLVKFNRMGCFLRDIDRGIVDFFHVRNNELVYLCWKRGEKKIGHWHDLDSGYTGRKPL